MDRSNFGSGGRRGIQIGNLGNESAFVPNHVARQQTRAG